MRQKQHITMPLRSLFIFITSSSVTVKSSEVRIIFYDIINQLLEWEYGYDSFQAATLYSIDIKYPFGQDNVGDFNYLIGHGRFSSEAKKRLWFTQKEAFMTLRVTHENENKLAGTDHSIMFKRVSIFSYQNRFKYNITNCVNAKGINAI